MAKLDDLKLDPNDKPNVDMENLPEEFGDFSAPPYPGNYTFLLPHELDFEPFKGNVLGKKDQERIRVNFDSAHPLVVMAATPENADEVGKMITMYRISNAEFEFTKAGEKVRASEMAFLLKGGLKGDVPKNASNLDWATALNKHTGEMFGAELEWEAYCNSDKKRWILDPDTQTRKEDNADGCGTRYSQDGYTKGDGTVVHPIPKESGEEGVGEYFAEDFPCQCGAQLRVRARLRRYGPVVLRPTTSA